MSTSRSQLRVGFVGAGTINFGGGEGPWDHATRLERMPGLCFVGIADPDTAKAEAVLASRRAGDRGDLYRDCVAYNNLETMLDRANPQAIILGTPPHCRGSLQPGKDPELTCVQAGIPVFVEKPLSVVPLEDFFKYTAALEKVQAEKGTIISVGYMFRYHSAVRKMKELIESHGGPVRSLSACYYMAYPRADRPFWWDVRQSGGPIVEQATHLVDIARYLGGEVDQDSIHTICQSATHPSAHLCQLPAGCDVGLPEVARVPRATMAIWRFQSGGIGSLTHVVALHGEKYEAYMDVLLDGVRLRMLDPYGSNARVEVRGMAENPEEEQVFHCGDCDPYEEELSAFIKAVRTGDKASIVSTYSDASKTYKLTWDIVNAAN